MSTTSTTTTSGSLPPMKVTIKSARFLTSWRWSVTKDPEDTCGICRLAYESCCPSCKLPGEDCPPIVGQCKHAFHMHCILTWLGTRDKESVCPLCRAPWEMASE